MADEAAKITASARLRGFRPRPGFTAWRTLGYLAAMILLRSWQRSARVNRAMRLRGFTGRFPLLDPHAPPTAREARLAGLLVPVFLLITLFLVALNNAASPASLP